MGFLSCGTRIIEVVMLLQTELKKLIRYEEDSGMFYWLCDRGSQKIKGTRAGYLHASGYRRIKIKGALYKEHRLAFLYMKGSFPKDGVDHINGVKDDNRWVNLRGCTQIANNKNSAMRKDNRTGCRGVHFSKLERKWKAFISNKGCNIHLGTFSDFFEAVCARKSAERRYGFHINHGRPGGHDITDEEQDA